MLVYKDLFSEDELCSDTYPCKEVDGVIIVITGKYTTETTQLDGAKFGANASEEEPSEGGDDPSSVSGLDIVLANRLIETGFVKKDYIIHIKAYIGRVIEKLKESGDKTDDEIAEIKKGLAKQVKEIMGEFKEYQFFMGESASEDGMMIPVKYVDEKPLFYFFKHGLIAEKV